MSENMKWRVKKKFEEGIPWTCTMLGYRFDGKKLIIDEDEATIVREIFDEYLNGNGYEAIAKKLRMKGHKSRYGECVRKSL